MDIYAQNILDHFKAPHNEGVLSDASIIQKEENHSCGDTLEVSMTIEKESIAKIAFQGSGCAISQAAMSILSDELVGMTMNEVQALS